MVLPLYMLGQCTASDDFVIHFCFQAVPMAGEDNSHADRGPHSWTRPCPSLLHAFPKHFSHSCSWQKVWPLLPLLSCPSCPSEAAPAAPVGAQARAPPLSPTISQ